MKKLFNGAVNKTLFIPAILLQTACSTYGLEGKKINCNFSNNNI
jgi:hypothetical protein